MNTHEFQQLFCQYIYNYPSIQSMNGQQSLVYAAGLDNNLQYQIQFNTNSQIFVTGLYSLLKQYGTLLDGRNPLAEIIKVVMGTVGKDKKEDGQYLLRELGEVNFDVIEKEDMQEPSGYTSITFQFEASSDIIKNFVAFLQQNGVLSCIAFGSRNEIHV